MKMSLFFIFLSAAIGVAMWFLIIGIVFSIGGGDIFTVTHYDSLFFYITVFLLCIGSCLLFAKHLLKKNLQLLLLICFGTTILSFFLTPWLIELKSSIQQEFSSISTSEHEEFMIKVEDLIEQTYLAYRVNIDKSRESFKEIRNINVIALDKTTNEEIMKNDIEGLLGLAYGKEVRLEIFNKSNGMIIIDFVIEANKSVSFCTPFKICENLGLDVRP